MYEYLKDKCDKQEAEIERLIGIIEKLRGLYFPNCKSYPTRGWMGSLVDDPDHGCDCKSCVYGRLLHSVLGRKMWED
jgi:hypothetical protein